MERDLKDREIVPKERRCAAKAYGIFLPVMTFLLTLLLSVLLFQSNGFAPFTEEGKTLLISDAQTQYIAYFRYYQQILKNSGNAVYTLGKAFGGDFLSIWTYYLASPWNLLLVFFSSEDIPSFLIWTDILRFSFASLNMYLLLRFTNDKPNVLYAIIGVAYGLCAYAIVYSWDFMWLDGMALLPLCVLSLHLLDRKKHVFLYPLILGLDLLSSWYIGFMACIFLVLYFLVDSYVLVQNEKDAKKKRKTFGKLFLVFALASLLGGLFSLDGWFVAATHFSGTKAKSALPVPEFLSLQTVFGGYFEQAYTSFDLVQQNSGYIPSGVSSVLLPLFVLFFFNKNYSRKERIGYLVLFLFYTVMSSNRFTDAVLHGLREPTWFPARYAFVFAFLVLFAAGKEGTHIGGTSPYGLLVPPVLYGLFALIFALDKTSFPAVRLSWVSALLYFASYLVCLIWILSPVLLKKKQAALPLLSSLLSVVLVPLSLFSTYRYADNILKANEVRYENISTYREDETYQKDIDLIREYDPSGNYRMEINFERPGTGNTISNSPMYYGYSGFSHYSSSEKKNVEDYFNYIGLHYNGYFEKYEYGSTLFWMSLFGLKYVVGKNYQTYSPKYIYHEPFEELEFEGKSSSGIHFYQNAYALPFGYSVPLLGSEEMENTAHSEEKGYYRMDHFEYQNSVAKALNPSLEEDLYLPLTLDESRIVKGGELKYEKKNGFYYLTGKEGAFITFSYTLPREGYGSNLYFGEQNWNPRFTYYLDSKKLRMTDYWHKGISGFEDTPSHVHTLRMTLTKDVTDVKIVPELYYENGSALKEFFTELKKNSSDNLTPVSTLFSYGYRGTFTKDSSKNLFLFTLPYEKEMHIYVDGKEQKLLKRMNIFCAADLSSFEDGEHRIEIRYVDSGFKAGTVLSLTGLGLSVASYGVWVYLKKKKKSAVIKADPVSNG